MSIDQQDTATSEKEAADNCKKQELRDHFSNNISKQTRLLVQMWHAQHLLYAAGLCWPKEEFEQLKAQALTVQKCCEKNQSAKYEAVTNALLHSFDKCFSSGNEVQISTKNLATLTKVMNTFNKYVSRRSDTQAEEDQAWQLPPLHNRMQIVMLSESSEDYQSIIGQMDYYGLSCRYIEQHSALEELDPSQISAFIVDLDFSGPEQGLVYIEQLQGKSDKPLPVIFISQQELDIHQKLRCIRCGGVGLHTLIDAQTIIAELNHVLKVTPDDPYKVLVMDDSKSQALYAEKMLSIKGIKTRCVTDPMQIFEQLEDFQPEVILMDMYMPGCTGVELATLIRQEKRYINIPIIYLSGEEDRDRQIEAMAEGGDEFLTKPIKPNHLYSTIFNRGVRARQLQRLISRDSLTGLLNHTYSLAALAQEMKNAEANGTPLCFAMIDIDKFKSINDTYGHPVGDVVIKNLSSFLTQRLRKSDGIGRYGGEEFALILPDTSLADGQKVLDGCRQHYSHLTHGEQHFNSTFSAGIAQYQGQSLSELLEQADQALYTAKHRGRNNVASH